MEIATALDSCWIATVDSYGIATLDSYLDSYKIATR